MTHENQYNWLINSSIWGFIILCYKSILKNLSIYKTNQFLHRLDQNLEIEILQTFIFYLKEKFKVKEEA